MWKDIKDWEDLYQISDTGLVFSKRMKKLVAQTLTNNSYYKVDLFSRAKGKIRRKSAYVHRLVAEAFIPKVPGKNYVDHIDNNKLNNKASNVQWITNSENVLKSYKVNPPKKFSFKFIVFIEGNKTFKTIKEASDYLGYSYEHCKSALRYWKGKVAKNITIKKV